MNEAIVALMIALCQSRGYSPPEVNLACLESVALLNPADIQDVGRAKILYRTCRTSTTTPGGTDDDRAIKNCMKKGWRK